MYCRNCGAKIENNARFCTSCGAKRQQGVPPSELYVAPEKISSQGDPVTFTAIETSQRKKRPVIAIVVSILVILLGLQTMSLSMVGKTTSAAVTSTIQDRKSYGQNMPDPNRYRVQYAFSVNGEQYSGSASMIFKNGVSSEQNIQVRYLPYYPAINSPANETKILGGLILTGLGTILLFLGVMGKITIGGRNRAFSVRNDDGRKL